MNRIVRKAVALSRRNSEWYTSGGGRKQSKPEVKEAWGNDLWRGSKWSINL